MKHHLGDISILNELPKSIVIQNDPYIIQKISDDEYALFDAICPHMHNVVSDIRDKVWRCPSHDWIFDSKNGNCLNVSNESLEKKNLIVENDQVYVNLDKNENLLIKKTNGEKVLPKITLVGSASLLIEWKNFNILTDPWMKGLCVFDSWVNYPPSGIQVNELPRIDAIWISHEHSDHFHLPTLMEFDKNIPIYVPDYDNNRLEKKLREFGFKNITSMKQEKIYNFSPEINAISFSRGHVFNDSILYLQLGNFSILNVNDAGFNWSIKHAIGDVDMVCMQFGPASAYPATWTHINEKAKIQLNKNRNDGMLRMIKQVLDATNAKYFIPFANFNELYHKDHLEFVLDSQSKNRPSDVVKFLKDYPIDILDILPGESWNGRTGKFSRRDDREDLFNKEHLMGYLEEIQEKQEFETTIPFEFNLTHKELKQYFESFSDSHLARRVGNYTVSLTLEHLDEKVHGFIKFDDGNITYEKIEKESKANLLMKCPGHLVQEIIRNDLYWDELVSGFWCEFSRDPDIYNVAFWQLLHVPWRARKIYDGKTNPKVFEIKKNSSIADIIEKGGSEVIEIFEKNGLFCVGCEASIGETIEEGCEIHGLNEKQRDKLILELGETVN